MGSRDLQAEAVMLEPYDDQDFDNLVHDTRAKMTRRPQEKLAATWVKRLMAKRGYDQIEQKDQMERVWQAVVGSGLGKLTRCGRLQRGKLEIIVSHSMALSELTFQKRSLLAELKKRPEGRGITDLKFKLGAID